MAGDELLKVDDQQAAATVVGVNMQLAHALTTKPTVLNGKKQNREREGQLREARMEREGSVAMRTARSGR